MRILPIPHFFPTLRGFWTNVITRQVVNPFYASFKITSRCHFACPFCNMKKRQVPDLDTDTVMRILDNLSRSSVLLTAFEGGEPLLRPDLGELLKYARTRRFYLLLTTSARDILDFPIREHARWIDFLHVSIDEGHDNLEMFDTVLPELTRIHPHVSVQTVVTNETIETLPEKVRRCHEIKASIVIMPASPMDDARRCFSDMVLLEDRVRSLRQRYPGTIHTPPGYFRAYRDRRCSSASVVIGPEGSLYYPCHIREEKGPNLAETDLGSWLRSPRAAALRSRMGVCERDCGWYQYYAVGDYLRIRSLFAALKPLLSK